MGVVYPKMGTLAHGTSWLVSNREGVLIHKHSVRARFTNQNTAKAQSLGKLTLGGSKALRALTSRPPHIVQGFYITKRCYERLFAIRSASSV